MLTSEDVARWPFETRVLMDAAIERHGAHKAVKVWTKKALARSIRKKHAPVRRFNVEHEYEGRLWVSSSDMAREVEFEDVEEFDFRQLDIPRALPPLAWFPALAEQSLAGRMVMASELIDGGFISPRNVIEILSPPATGDSVTINGVTFTAR